MIKNTETWRKKEHTEEKLPEIHTDEEYEARLLRILERRRAEKQRQMKRRKMIRRLPFAALIVLALVLVGMGAYMLADRIQTSRFQNSVEELTREGEIQAQKQPVMSGADVEKMASSTSVAGIKTRMVLHIRAAGKRLTEPPIISMKTVTSLPAGRKLTGKTVISMRTESMTAPRNRRWWH